MTEINELDTLGQKGWRWELTFEPNEPTATRYFCILSLGQGPPPLGRYVRGQGSTMQTAISRAMKRYAKLEHLEET